MKKELLTDKLRLVPVETQDCDLILAMLSNDKIKKYLCDNKDIEKEVVESIISKSESLFEEKGIGLWLIKDQVNHSIKGFCGFLNNDVLELIYVIHPDFQNNGFATESSLRVIDYFNQLKLKDDIFAKIDLPNVESHLVANKIGMKEVGIEKNLVTGEDMKLYKLELNRDLDLRQLRADAIDAVAAVLRRRPDTGGGQQPGVVVERGPSEAPTLSQSPAMQPPGPAAGVPPIMYAAYTADGRRVGSKSKIVAGLLGILLPGLGLQRFYLGYTGMGLFQLFLTICTCGIASIWGFVEGIVCLCGGMQDADGYELRD